VALDEAKRELAEKALLAAKADALAKKAADSLLAALKGGETIEAVEERLNKEKEAAGEAAQAPLVKDARFGRGGSPIPGVDGGALVAQAFEMNVDKPLPEAPVKASDSYVVFKLVSRETADKAGFAGAEEERLSEALLRRKRADLLEDFVRNLRKKADSANAVRINPDAVAYGAGDETASL
jgi:hypothetical protein